MPRWGGCGRVKKHFVKEMHWLLIKRNMNYLSAKREGIFAKNLQWVDI